MNDMDLTEAEEAVFKELRKLKIEDGITLTKLTEMFPGTTRHSMSVRMKYLTAKLAPHGWIITNAGGIGRGNKAIYTMEKRF